MSGRDGVVKAAHESCVRYRASRYLSAILFALSRFALLDRDPFCAIALRAA
jgi:hypothetical protein